MSSSESPSTAAEWRAARDKLDAANEAAIIAERERQVRYLAERDHLSAELGRAEEREALAAARDRLIAEANAADAAAQRATEAADAADETAAERDAEADALRQRATGLRDRATARRADADAATLAGADEDAIAARADALALDDQAQRVEHGIAEIASAADAARSEAAASRERAKHQTAYAVQRRLQLLADPLEVRGRVYPRDLNPFMSIDAAVAEYRQRRNIRIPE